MPELRVNAVEENIRILNNFSTQSLKPAEDLELYLFILTFPSLLQAVPVLCRSAPHNLFKDDIKWVELLKPVSSATS